MLVRAIVVGGGIGGLTAAIALRRIGVEVVVFERAGELREIGAGISLWVNAMKALERIGLAEAVRAAGREEIGVRSVLPAARRSRRFLPTLWRRGSASTSSCGVPTSRGCCSLRWTKQAA